MVVHTPGVDRTVGCGPRHFSGITQRGVYDEFCCSLAETFFAELLSVQRFSGRPRVRAKTRKVRAERLDAAPGLA